MNSKILTFLIFIIINQIFTNKSQAQEGINLVSDFFPGSNSGQPIQFVKVNNNCGKKNLVDIKNLHEKVRFGII